MSKLYFCDSIARAIPKSRVRRMLQAMEANAEETRLMIERFCDGKSAEIIHDEWMSKHKQRITAEFLSMKLESWLWDNLGFFDSSEVKNILRVRVNDDD